METMIELIVVAAAGIAGFVSSRDFTRKKLRFVDAAQSSSAPWVAAGAVALIATPLAILPLITVGSALALGVGAGLGVRSAQRDRHLLP